MSDSTTRLVMLCPCCGGEVTHQRYGFDVLRPPKWLVYYVCDACETALTGHDTAGRAAAETAFLNYLKIDNAPTPT